MHRAICIFMLMKYKLCVAFLLCACAGFTQRSVVIELPAASYDRVDMPVSVLHGIPTPPAAYYRLKAKNSNKVILARSDGDHLVFIPSTTIPSGKKITYTATPLTSPPAKTIRFQMNDRGVTAHVNGKPVFHYQAAIAMPPADSPRYYQRSGFIHPLYTPSGSILTDDFPEGHVHQHAIFMAWSNTLFRGKKIDFWNQHLQTGTVKHVEVLEATDGAIFGRLKVKLRHVGSEAGTVLEETWTITVYQLQKNFLFDLESIQKNTTSDTLFLQQYLYGGMAMRGSKYWNNHSNVYTGDTMQMITSEGKGRAAASHTHARYVTMYGKIKNATGGVTVFDHTENFRHPQAIRVHPEMPYWVYAPVVDGKFEITPRVTYRSRYRYFIFDDHPDPKRIASLAENWKMF